MVKVEAFSALAPCLSAACRLGHRCQGLCPRCGQCVDLSHGLWGGVMGVAMLCLFTETCTFGEVMEDPEGANG